MKNQFKYFAYLFLLCLTVAAFASGPGKKSKNDWPQWRGPNRDGISKETGILKSWPEDGPKVLWSAPSGDGYAGISVTNGKLYTMYGQRQGADAIAICLDAASGEELWRFRMGSKFTNNFGHGPRATPTVDGNLVFVLSGEGKLFALNATKGTEVWGHDLHKEYGGKIPTWGVSTSPLVEGNMLIVDVGGKDGYGLVAFNKKNGKVIWKSASGIPGYSAPIAVTVNGTRQILSLAGKALVSVSPKDGKQYWHYSWVTDYDVNAATPVFIKPDKVFISSGYNKGAAILKMKAANGTVGVEEIWKGRGMHNHFSSSILVGDHLYGFDEKTLRCLNVNTQESKWEKKGFKKGSLMYADGHLIVLSEKGLLVLVEATPEAFVQKASAQVLKGRCWTAPTLVDGMLYLRNQKDILCLDLSDGNQS